MANPRRYAFQFRSSPVPAVTDIFAEINIGASGAPTLVALHGVGVTSVVKNATGKYTIALDNLYPRLLAVQYTAIGASGAVAAAPDLTVLANNVASAGTIQIETSTGGVATNPASGEVMLLQITLKNSSIPVG